MPSSESAARGHERILAVGNETFNAEGGRAGTSSAAHTRPRLWRLRWWLARTFKTRDYHYVENERGLPDEF